MSADKLPIFRRIGNFSAKHDRKIVVAWIALLIIMSPFAIMFFSDVNFNIDKSLVPSSSMTSRATALESQYFASSASSSSVVIVTNNTSIVTQQGNQHMISYLKRVNETLLGMNNYTGLESIYSIECSALESVATHLQEIIDGGNSSITLLNHELYALIPEVNSSTEFVFGIPLFYLDSFLKSKNASLSYDETMHYLTEINDTSLGIPYLNSFTIIWNSTYVHGSTSTFVSIMNSSIEGAFSIKSDEFVTVLTSSGERSYLGLLTNISQQYSLARFINYSQPYFHDSNFTSSFSVGYLSNEIASNQSFSKFLLGINVSARTFVQDVFNLTSSPTQLQILNLARYFSENAIENDLRGDPDIYVNGETFQNFVSMISPVTNISSMISSLMINEPFDLYPILPKPYVYHQFVGYNNSTIITILLFNGTISTSESNSISTLVSGESDLIPGGQVFVSSSTGENTDIGNAFSHGLVTSLSIGIALSVLIIGVFFRSPVAAILPLSMFGFSSVIAMGINGIIYKFILRTQVSFITPTLLLILLLGLTSDYVVYIMARYRREVKNGNKEAAQESARWSGYAVATSGVTVALSYLVLWISGIPIFSDSGLTNFIGVSVAIVLANTLLIAILNRYGKRVFWPSNLALSGKIPMEKTMSRVARFTINNKKKVFVIFILVALGSIYVYMSTPTGLNLFNLIPQNSAIQATKVVNDSFDGDFFERGFVVFRFNGPLTVNATTYNLTEMEALTSAENAMLNSSGISQIYGPTYPFGYYQSASLSNVSSSYVNEFRNQIDSYIGTSAKYAIVFFQTSQLAWNQASINTVTTMDNTLSSLSHSLGFTYDTGGLTQGILDTFNYASSTFLETVPILLIAIFVALFIQLFSLFTPMRLIVMVMIAVLAALSVTYIAMSLIGYNIIIFTPIFTVITLLAVGLDYDIFLVTRIKEEAMKGATPRDSIRIGIKENGGVIIALGMVLFVTFFALNFTGIGILQEIGTALALGVLIDTFVSWPFFVPVVMLYMSKYNWWPAKIAAK